MDEPDRYNEYGHTACPRCGLPHRYMTIEEGNNVFCPDCWHVETATRANSNELSAAELEDEEKSA